MAERVETYAQWLVANQDKKGTPEFETVAAAYKALRAEGGGAKPQAARGGQGAPREPEGEGLAAQGVYGFNQGLGGILETFRKASPQAMGAEALRFAGDQLGFPETAEAIAGPLSGEQLYDAVGEVFKTTPPVTAGERIVRRAGQEIGASVPFAALPLGAAVTRPAAAGVQQMMPGIRNAVQRGVDTLVRGIGQKPAMAAAGELVATTGSGTGAGVAQEVAPGNPYAELGGQLVGGILPGGAAATIRPVARTLWNVIKTGYEVTPWRALLGKGGFQAYGDRLQNVYMRNFGNRAVDRSREQIAKMTGGLSEAERANATAAGDVQRRIPGFKPSIAEQTDSPALIATQADFEKRASGQQLEQLARRRQANQQAVEDFSDDVAPAATNADPEFVLDAATGEVTALRQRIATAQDRARQTAEATANQLPVADRRATGETIRNDFDQARTEAISDMDARAQELGIADNDASFQWRDARDQMIAEWVPDWRLANTDSLPPALRDLVNEQRAAETARQTIASPDASPEMKMEAQAVLDELDTFTFQDFKRFRERIGDEYRDRNRMLGPNKDRDMRILGGMRSQMDEFLQSFVNDADPGIAQNYRTFLDEYYSSVIDRFEHGTAVKVTAADQTGYYRTQDEDVAALFFKPGADTNAADFNKIFRNSPDANAALEAAALDSLRDSAVRDGVLDPRLLQTWIRNHASVLEQFPHLRSIVGDFSNATTAVQARMAQLEARADGIGRNMLVKELDRVAGGGKTPELVIQSALNDPRKMQALATRLRNQPEALDALKRYIWEMARSGDTAAQTGFLDRYEPALRVVLGQPHIDNLRTINAAMQMIERVPSPKGQPYDVNPMAGFERATGFSIPSAEARAFAVAGGRVAPSFAVTTGFIRFFRSKQKAAQDALLQEALYDPDVARDLATLVNSQYMKPEVVRRLNTRLFILGYGGEDEQQAEQE